MGIIGGIDCTYSNYGSPAMDIYKKMINTATMSSVLKQPSPNLFIESNKSATDFHPDFTKNKAHLLKFENFVPPELIGLWTASGGFKKNSCATY